jgi:DNA-directed RNA polymerase subunit N (RpoN/RPB10)
MRVEPAALVSGMAGWLLTLEQVMKSCISCGDALHPERAEKYDYCTKPECQEKNAKGLTIVSVGVNKSSDQFMVLNEQTSEDLASGKHHDPRRGSYGRQADAHGGKPASQPAPERSPDPVAPSKPRPASRPARRQWTESQQRLAVLYNEQGLSPGKIAEKLGLSRYTVTQMILTTPRRRPR